MKNKIALILCALACLLSCANRRVAALEAENARLQMQLDAYLEQVDALNRPYPRHTPTLLPPAVPFSDMILCYGGSPNRGALNVWSADRFAASVTYTDPSGEEHWLYDGFLAIEPRLWGRSSEPADVALSQEDPGGKMSGHKEHWQELIDYWMAPDNGFACLDAAIAAAAARLGEPPCPRKVVMNLPDAVLHEYFEDLHSRTAYWGEAGGRELDFARPEDRAEACKWYISEVNRRFAEAGYRYLELIGFYIHCEEIPTPVKGWRWAWKQQDRYLPLVADYLHERGQYLTWIPYREAASYDSVEELGIDLAWMQPNYYWEGDRYPWDASLKMILDNGLGMEFEFDDRLLTASPEHAEQRRRFYLYIDYAKSTGLYGTRSFTYFQDHDTMYNLLHSEDPQDRKVYDDLCGFVIGNPLRGTVR